MSKILIGYAIGVVLWIGYQVVEDARGNVEFGRYTLVEAVLWPFWLAFVIIVILALLVVDVAEEVLSWRR